MKLSGHTCTQNTHRHAAQSPELIVKRLDGQRHAALAHSLKRFYSLGSEEVHSEQLDLFSCNRLGSVYFTDTFTLREKPHNHQNHTFKRNVYEKLCFFPLVLRTVCNLKPVFFFLFVLLSCSKRLCFVASSVFLQMS